MKKYVELGVFLLNKAKSQKLKKLVQNWKISNLMKIFSKKFFIFLIKNSNLYLKNNIFKFIKFLFEIISLSILPLFASALIDLDFTKKKISSLIFLIILMI